jgi:hypothetical protein
MSPILAGQRRGSEIIACADLLEGIEMFREEWLETFTPAIRASSK